jgi:hypothetical protein
MASQGLSGADADTRGWRRNGGARATDAGEDFRPEVSTRYARDYPISMKSKNSTERVLFKISAVLAVLASLVLVVSLLLPGGISQWKLRAATRSQRGRNIPITQAATIV